MALLPQPNLYVPLSGGAGVRINETSDGTLRCSCKITPLDWCPHLEEAVRDHSDASLIWVREDTPEGEYFDITDKVIVVPMVPSKQVYANVTLGKVSHGGAYSVLYRTAKHTDRMPPEFIGFLHPSEGRFIIREMLYDWFRGHREPKAIPCKSPSHGYKAQMAWERDLTTGGSPAFAQQWSVLDIGICLHCKGVHGLSNWDDLIPEASPKRTVF